MGEQSKINDFHRAIDILFTNNPCEKHPGKSGAICIIKEAFGIPVKVSVHACCLDHLNANHEAVLETMRTFGLDPDILN